MKEVVSLTREQAQAMILAHHGLGSAYIYEGKPGVLDYIQRVGCIQFDPLNIVGHNSELVLQSRVAGFKPSVLRELLYQDRKLLDGWDKVMSIYCMEDWPYFRRRREVARNGSGERDKMVDGFLPQVRQAVEERGPLTSLDLGLNEVVDWYWSPTHLGRAALERLYSLGELVIHHRVHTRKAYDLACRHIAPEILNAPEPNPAQEQFFEWHLLRRIGGVGLLWNRAGDAWVGMDGMKSVQRTAAFHKLLTQEKLQEINVEGIKLPLYMRCEDFEEANRRINQPATDPRAIILAPLDNLLWDRRLVEELFGFSYRWEVYKPAAERQYGYYVLPVLYGKRFIGRFEPGRERKTGALIIKQWWWENGIQPTLEIERALQLCFARFLDFLDLKTVRTEAGVLEQPGMGWVRELL